MAAAGEDPDIYFNDPAYNFSVAILDSNWPNSPNQDNPITYRDRAKAIITAWVDFMDVRPCHDILFCTDPPLPKKNMFFLTEKALKSGLAQCFIYRGVFGDKTVWPQDSKEGLLSSLSEMGNLYTGFIKPLALLFVAKYNPQPHKDFLLEEHEMLDKIHFNWKKNIVERGSRGAWSDAEILSRIEEETIESTDCKGLYLPWFEMMMRFFPDFYEKCSGPGHIVTDFENSEQSWRERFNAQAPI